jgi:hypothetical protein
VIRTQAFSHGPNALMGALRLASLVTMASCLACNASTQVKVGGSASANVSADQESATSPEPPPAANAAPAAPPASAEQPPPAPVCPLACHVAAGAARIDVSEAELQQLRAGLAPVLGRMQGCVAAESWRRHGSPVLNLRVAPDGKIAEIGVDPHHLHDTNHCFEGAAAAGAPNVSLPGRTTVRCAERCEPERPARKPRRK